MLIPIPNVNPIDPVYFVGVDLGQRGSHTAFIILERFEEQPEFTDLLRGAPLRIRYIVRQAIRVPLGTPYSEVSAQLKTIIQKLTPRGTTILVIDETGAGIPIIEMFRKDFSGTGARLIPLTITSGQTASSTTVPRAALVTKLQVMAERQELEIAQDCRDIDILKQELANLSLTKSSDSDDLALALCLACWRAKVR